VSVFVESATAVAVGENIGIMVLEGFWRHEMIPFCFPEITLR
jgi:hypothetical protein